MQATDSSSSESASTVPNFPQNEPILIKGTGKLTLFGLNNCFNTKYPTQLRTRLAPEEFKTTILLINKVLRRKLINNWFWCFCGGITFCCTFSCSMCPAIYFNKRTIQALQKTLRSENDRLYHKLGMHWSLHKQFLGPFSLVEYILVIHFLPKPGIYVPD